MVIAELTREVEKIISNSDSPRLEAEYIVMAATGMKRGAYLMNKREKAAEETERAALLMAKRRKGGEPLAYILGFTEFMGLPFAVTADTLIPRADTETLVEIAVTEIGDKCVRALDIGTGSGCIGISIAKFCKNADVTLLDINEGAIKTAKENAIKNNVKVKLLKCDILTELPEGEYDVIVSNPPYIRTDVIGALQTEVKDFEPLAALDGGADGLIFYRRIAEAAESLLKSGGMLMFEIGFDQAEEVKKVMADYDNVRCVKDLCGNDRVVYGYKKGD